MPGKGSPAPVQTGRGSLVQRVYAGGGGSGILAGAERVKWTPGWPRPDRTADSSSSTAGPGDGDGDRHYSDNGDSWELPGVELVAPAQNHTLLLQNVVGVGGRKDQDAGGETQVLVWGSGRQGQV